jgi:hypothetical protein
MKITSLNVKSELIDISTAYEPDPNWVFVDTLGKEHRWAYAANHKWHLPTLRIRVVHDAGDMECSLGESPCPGAACERCDDFKRAGYDREEFFVPETGEAVEPGYRTAAGPRYMRGLTAYLGEYESDELPRCGNGDAYRFEECDVPCVDVDMHGEFLVTTYGLGDDGVYRGTWQSTGEVTESARVPST